MRSIPRRIRADFTPENRTSSVDGVSQARDATVE
jgi:hypothetical protein